MERADLLRAPLDLLALPALQPLGQLVELQPALPDEPPRIGEPRPARLERRPPPVRIRSQGADEPRAPLGKIGDQLLLHPGEDFRRGRRRRRAHVSGEVRDRVVDLVTHRAHRRDRTSEESARHHLLVERPQIFQAPAAASDHQHVHAARRRSPGNAPRDLLGRTFALHPRRNDEHRQVGISPVQHAQEIVDRGARGAGHHRDAAGQEGQLPLPRRIEESLRFETSAHLLEGDLQGAGAERLEGIADDLVPALRLVEREPASDQHRESVVDGEAEPARLAREQHRVDAGVLILEREIKVPARGPAQIRDLPLDVEAREAPFEDALHLPGQLADRVDPLRGRRRLRLAGAGREEIELACGASRGRLVLGLLPWKARRKAFRHYSTSRGVEAPESLSSHRLAF